MYSNFYVMNLLETIPSQHDDSFAEKNINNVVDDEEFLGSEMSWISYDSAVVMVMHSKAGKSRRDFHVGSSCLQPLILGQILFDC